uniref:AAA+ ATPase domain-containing protein n=1 Tax=Pseudo-nitzschia australis TaxID=44445 RepID=A0A7S4ABP0_9STRA
MPSTNNNTNYDDMVDEIIDALSNLLEFVGILPSSENDNGLNDNLDGDPWVRLSNSLKEMIVSLGKLRNLMSTNGTDGIDNDNDIMRSTSTNELIMDIENAIHQVRGNIESVSAMLAKGVSTQLTTCRKLESMSSRNTSLTLLTQLRPMAKALASAIRRQKAVWLQSLHMTEDAFDQLYITPDHNEEIIENLQIVYKRVNRRCISPDSSPWKEAVNLIKFIASSEIIRGDTDSTRATTTAHADSRDAMIVNVPIRESPSIVPALRHFASSTCASSQLQSIVNIFFHEKQKNNDEYSKVLSILVVGPEGSGKTHLLDQIGNQCRVAGVDIDIVHPMLPFDAIGTTVGAAEDILISMVCYAKTGERNCILLLDDIDSICGQTEQSTTMTGDTSGGQREPHLTARLRNLFLSLLDIMKKRNYDSRNGRMVLICSSKENFGKGIDRFDKILPLLHPNKEERKLIISNYSHSDVSVDNLAECTLGFSRAEIAHHCRQALSTLHSRRRKDNGAHDFVRYLKEKLQSSTPESLKNGVNADFVEMKVFSARDLQQLYPIQNPENPVADLPIFGESAKAAWKELKRLVVLPVCQGEALDKILYHRGGRSSKKTFAGGVLLAASPGTGKSTMAYFSAAVASSINSSIKLIDVSCTSLIHKEVGGSEKALHRLFQSARSATPCILVMDGIENIAAVRGNDNTTEGTMDRVLSTLLTELDGAESETSTNPTTGGMAIIGITHNPKWIDPALRRPGRLERTIWLRNPDLAGRKCIVMKELGNAVYKPDYIHPELRTLDDLAVRVALETDGYTGAEVIAICNESKLLAFNDFFKDSSNGKKDFITPQLVFEAARTQRSNG